MGQVIRSTASGDDKINDMRTTKINADALGGVWKSTAEAKLGPTLALLDKVEDDLVKHSQIALPLIAVAAAEKKKSDLLLGRVYDDVWNALGRSASDPVLNVVFPGGFGWYTEGSSEDQPSRMELLASLLESEILTKLPSEMAKSLAKELRDGADVLRNTLNAARAARASMSLFENMRLALSRSGQIELAGLKRLYKAHGFTEAQIHQVIPHRPAAPAKKAEGSTTGPGKKEEGPAAGPGKKAEAAVVEPGKKAEAVAAEPAKAAEAPLVALPQETGATGAGPQTAPSPAVI